MGRGGKIRVAVIDTGLADTCSYKEDVFGGCKFWVEKQSIYMLHEWEDVNGHGTMVTSIIKRYCPECLLYIIKIYDDKQVTSSILLLQALEHLLEVDVNFINISLAVNSQLYTEEMSETIRSLKKQGKIIFASVKNGAITSFPANDSNCYGVLSAEDLPLCGYRFCSDSEIDFEADGVAEYVEALDGKKRWFKGNSKATAKMLGISAFLLQTANIDKTEISARVLEQQLSKYDESQRGFKSMQVIAKVVDLCKNYGEGDNQVKALRKVNLEIMKGEFVAVLGASGSGKSTLLNILGGLEKATSGNVWLDGVVIDGFEDDKLADIRAKKIGIVFQNFNLVPILTVYENIVMTVEIAGNDVDKEYVERLIAFLGLKGLEERMPNQLSGGQQQRVAIARALASKPVLILADEPTGNLDSQSGKDVVELFRKSVDEFRQTVLMITHNVEHAKYCDRIMKIKDGEVVTD